MTSEPWWLAFKKAELCNCPIDKGLISTKHFSLGDIESERSSLNTILSRLSELPDKTWRELDDETRNKFIESHPLKAEYYWQCSSCSRNAFVVFLLSELALKLKEK